MKAKLLTYFCAFAVILSSQNIFALALESKDITNGTLTVNGNSVQLKHIYVIDWNDVLGVFLTDVPIGLEQNPFTLAMQGKIKGLSFIISKETKTRIVEAIYDPSFSSGWIHTLGESCTLELTRLDQKAIEGRLFTAKPEKWGAGNGSGFAYDVTFKAAIRPPKENPNSIRIYSEGHPKLIGEESNTAPFPVFESYHIAVLNNKVDLAKSYMSRRYIDKFKTNGVEAFVGSSRLFRPRELLILKSETSEVSAKLTVLGSRIGMLTLGRIEMIVEEGEWKVIEERWR